MQAWINTVGATVSRHELLSVINSLSHSNDKEALLKRHGFTKVSPDCAVHASLLCARPWVDAKSS